MRGKCFVSDASGDPILYRGDFVFCFPAFHQNTKFKPNTNSNFTQNRKKKKKVSRELFARKSQKKSRLRRLHLALT